LKTCFSIVLITIMAISFASAEIDYHPRLIVAELITASWSDDASAYTGIDDMMNLYHHGEVIPVRYYTSDNGGQYSSPSVENLIQGYDIPCYPSMIVNGKTRVSGTSITVEMGSPYRSMIEKDYYKPAPVKMVILDFDSSTGHAEVQLIMLSDSFSIDDGILRFILIEDDVDADVTNLARAVEEESFLLSGQNGTVNLETTFTLDPSWNEDNLRIMAYALDDNREIIQAVSTYPAPDSYVRTAIPEQRMDIGTSSGLYEVSYFTIFNMGNEINLTISVSMDNAPDGWLLTYCDEDGLCYFGPLNFQMTTGEYRKFHANIIPDGPGMMDYSIHFQSGDLTDDYIIPFRYITNDVNHMIIDGDGWQNYESYTAEILENDQYTYGIWDTRYAEVNYAISDYFSSLIWITGEREPALTSVETDFLENHLEQGNHLFISGQNIGKDLTENPLYNNIDFYHNYLNAELLSPDTDQREVYGIEGNEITDGLVFSISGGDGADNQYSPEKIDLAKHSGTEILLYPDDAVAAISSSIPSNARVVYLAFGFEAIADYSERRVLLLNSLNWLETTDVDDHTIPEEIASMRLYPSYPNPFKLNNNGNGSRSDDRITISFDIAQKKLAENITISIYNIRGQLIRKLTDPNIQNDKGLVTWDARDKYGILVVSGVYFYTLTDGYDIQAGKLLIIK